MNHRITISENGESYDTLTDILPVNGKLKILFIGKVPTHESVGIGHYLQGKQGKMFWDRLCEYGILEYPVGAFADDYLLERYYGITDIVKQPRDYRDEPSEHEYRKGYNRIIEIVDQYNPKVIVFIYKKVLDKILTIRGNKDINTNYGFNPAIDKLFESEIFVFPMNGLKECPKEKIVAYMKDLQEYLWKIG